MCVSMHCKDTIRSYYANQMPRSSAGTHLRRHLICNFVFTSISQCQEDLACDSVVLYLLLFFLLNYFDQM